ncbi:hypothetical protein CN918_28480 [Priestia megaterium]|nr:hypothetical protein CN918_28480 [Priestia megaterium]
MEAAVTYSLDAKVQLFFEFAFKGVPAVKNSLETEPYKVKVLLEFVDYLDNVGHSSQEYEMIVTNLLELFKKKKLYDTESLSKVHQSFVDLLCACGYYYGIPMALTTALQLQIDKKYADYEVEIHTNIDIVQTAALSMNSESAWVLHVYPEEETIVPLKARIYTKEKEIGYVYLFKQKQNYQELADIVRLTIDNYENEQKEKTVV